MASNDSQLVSQVIDITNFADRSIISAALKANHGDVGTVILEYFDDPDKFRRKYGWDESAFSSTNREGEEDPLGSTSTPSFAIHAEDNPVLYGTEPNSFYAPSRPPSRTNDRSPMSRLTDITANEYTTDAPSNLQEEEAHLQRAITESLSVSGVQSPQAMPLPPPPPLPQQTGVTSNGETSVYFGPANRPDYDPDEWAMVRLKRHGDDPEPAFRTRKPGMPVLLRCREDVAWSKHRIGALLMILHQIPAARNALLQTGVPPAYGYGNKSDWWKGQAILPPARSEPDGWETESSPAWSDELHRLIAFLDGTERSYGTADILARTRYERTMESSDPEKDFFCSFYDLQYSIGTRENMEVLTSTVEILGLEDLSHQGGDHFNFLDLMVSKDASPMPETLYQVLDSLFFADLQQAMEDTSIARMAWIIQASDVLTFRFQGDDGLPRPIEIPETFYADRYMSTNGTRTQKLQKDMLKLYRAIDANMRKESSLIRWVNPKTDKSYDRRVITKTAVHRCQEKIRKIKNRAFWRRHEQESQEEDYYLPEHTGEPSLLPDEASVVEHYETTIRQLEKKVADIERVMNEVVLPERRALQDIAQKMSSLLTVPSADGKWSPTCKYTLRGVVSDPNTVFQRIRGPVGAEEAAPTETPAEGAPASEEEQWWRISYKAEGDAVEHTPVSYETVMKEACGISSQPILVYATDSALSRENLPLSDALKAFVKLDNRHFKQEIMQADRLGHSPDRKRSAVLGDDSQSKRLQRTVSMESIATNHASAGDLDDEMRDIPPGNVSEWENPGDFTGDGSFDQGDHHELVQFPPPAGDPPPYEKDMEMEAGVSPALAQVSLQDVKRNSPPRGPEMQERPKSVFSSHMHNGGAGADGTVAPPITLVDNDKDVGLGPQINGV
ncbi:hypothetical protein VTK26DRAFT_9354 [Humicola hyalothermophila]